MKEISVQEKRKISGGAVNWGLAALIGAAVSFLFGIYNGHINLK